jgi:hypothetical protein
MKIRILESATNDLIDGASFYELQQQGLGEYFLNSLFSDIDSLALYAGIHAIFFGQYYRLLAKRFPFAVYYKIDGNMVKIYAVLDCRRNPAWTRKQMMRQ